MKKLLTPLRRPIAISPEKIMKNYMQKIEVPLSKKNLDSLKTQK